MGRRTNMNAVGLALMALYGVLIGLGIGWLLWG